MVDKIKAIFPVLFIAALEAEKKLKEVWWRCKHCEKLYEAHNSFCPDCGSFHADKVLKPFTGKIGIMRFIDE